MNSDDGAEMPPLGAPDQEKEAANLARREGQQLRRALLATAREATQIAEIRLPAQNGNVLAEAYRSGNVLSRHNVDGQTVLRARVDEQLASRLTRSGGSVAYSR